MSTADAAQLELFAQAPARPRDTTPAIPASRLTEHLIARGHLTESGLTRAARIHTCPRCRAHILAGLDGDVMAFETRTDPQPLTPLGEALAHIDNRGTWALNREENRYVLNPRDHHEITHHPATSRAREDVLAAHLCGQPMPEAVIAPSSFIPTTRPLPPGSPAPF